MNTGAVGNHSDDANLVTHAPTRRLAGGGVQRGAARLAHPSYALLLHHYFTTVPQFLTPITHGASSARLSIMAVQPRRA